VDYFQGLFMRLADVLTHITDHARRAGDELAVPASGAENRQRGRRGLKGVPRYSHARRQFQSAVAH